MNRMVNRMMDQMTIRPVDKLASAWGLCENRVERRLDLGGVRFRFRFARTWKWQFAKLAGRTD